MPPVLQLDLLSKSYGSFRALSEVSLQVQPGEIVGLLGPNGSGKTTALRLILGFLQPTSGRALLAGFDCWQQSVHARERVAYLPAELRLYENMTGLQLVQFLSKLRRQPLADNFHELAKRLDIDLQKPLTQLSSGMKRKVALFQVLLPEVPLLLLDEPTNALDPNMREELLQQLSQARAAGKAVIFSSHVLSEVEKICDRVAILQRGRLVHLQTMAELRQGRYIQARFEQAPSPMPALPGLRVCAQSDRAITLEHTGELSPLLAWLGQQSLRDLRMEPLGLQPVYQQYHEVSGE